MVRLIRGATDSCRVPWWSSEASMSSSQDRSGAFRQAAADCLPDPNAEYGHDPHCVRLHPAMPDRLYQQNHTGIYRLDRPSRQWQDIGATMPKSVGSIGFPVVM